MPVKGRHPVDVLLVEDTETDAELTLRALRSGEFFIHVHWAQDGADALDFMFCTGLHSHRDPDQLPSIVLLDLNLPKIGGLEVLRRLRSDPRTQAVPVVVMTASCEAHALAELRGIGIHYCIQKPVQFASFVDTVSKLGLYWILGRPGSRSPSSGGGA